MAVNKKVQITLPSEVCDLIEDSMKEKMINSKSVWFLQVVLKELEKEKEMRRKSRKIIDLG